MPHKMSCLLRPQVNKYGTSQLRTMQCRNMEIYKTDGKFRCQVLIRRFVSSVCNVQCLPGLTLSWCVVIHLSSVRTFPQPAKTISTPVMDFFPFPRNAVETSRKLPWARCIQLGFAIYNVSNGEKVRISKKKKEWCPSLCCGLWIQAPVGAHTGIFPTSTMDDPQYDCWMYF